MDIIDLIISRRSIRKFNKQKKIDDQTIEKILKAAMYAPSAVNKQPWHFLLFDDSKTVEQIIEVHPNSKLMRTAPMNILVCLDEDEEYMKGYGYQDCSAAIQNILLASHSLGLGSCWMGIYPREERIAALKDIFNLPNNIIPFAVVAIGYPEEKKEIPNRFHKEKIHFGKW